jgi:hypothetical protein
VSDPPPQHDAVLREGLASALYVALVLLATLVVVPLDRLPSDRAMVELVVGAAAGLVVAHWVAFRLATRLADEGGRWSAEAAREGAAQLVGGVAVACCAAVPFLFLDGRAALLGSLVVLAAVPALAGVAIARRQARSWPAAIGYGAAALVLAGASVVAKAALTAH